MNRMFQRVQRQSGDFRVMRALIWFTCAGAMLYGATNFWFGWQETLAALSSLGW